MTVVIDYGLGNLASVYNALIFLGAAARVSDSPRDIEKADKLILPGVGAFGDAVGGLRKRALVEPLKTALLGGKPYLGICLGLQILFEESEEGRAKGLAIFKGRVKRFQEKDGIKIPHIGWNDLKLKNYNFPAKAGSRQSREKLMNNIKGGSYFYFDHSYYAEPEDEGIIVATTDYGANFASVICRDNVHAVQFHPERSQKTGLGLLENFIKLC